MKHYGYCTTGADLACQQWVRGKEPMVDVAMREHAVNDSAMPQSETMQMTYRVMRCIEAIYKHCTSLLSVVL